MEQSRQYQEILKLGKTLAGLFSDHGRTDLTTAWMAHYLGELMLEAENEQDVTKKRSLQKECSEIILNLWDKRNHFPTTIAPLSGLSHAVSIIKALKDDSSDDLYWRRFRETESDSVWGTYLYRLRRAVEDAFKVTLSAAVAKQVLDREKKWGKHKMFLLDQEKEIIEFLDKELDKNDYEIKIIYTNTNELEKPKDAPDKMRRVFNKLREYLDKQTKALDDLESKVVAPKNGIRKSRQKKKV